MENIAIIGAGPAGCSAAYHLRKQGHTVTIFEKDAIVGGRTQGYRSDGFTLDTGAAFLTNFYPRVIHLLKELELKSSMRALHRVTGLYHRGEGEGANEGELARLNISSMLSFLRFPLAGFSDKFKMAQWIAGLTLKRKKFDLADSATLCAYDSQSVGDYARQRLNEKIYDLLIRPGIEPFWYFSCEDVSEGLLLALSSRAAGAKFYFLSGGIDQICQQLAAGAQQKLHSEVMSVDPMESGFRLTFKSQDQSQDQSQKTTEEIQMMEVDRVIFATTAQIAHRLSKDLPEELVSTAQKEFLASQQYVSNIHATFRVEALDEDPRCSSILPCGSGQHDFAALSFHHAKNHEQHQLVSLYLPGHESDRLMDWSDESLYDHCEMIIDKTYPKISKPKTPFHLIRRPAAIPVHAVGRYRQATQFQSLQHNSKVQFCGDYLSTATIEGAVATGIAVSEMVASQSVASQS